MRKPMSLFDVVKAVGGVREGIEFLRMVGPIERPRLPWVKPSVRKYVPTWKQPAFTPEEES